MDLLQGNIFSYILLSHPQEATSEHLPTCCELVHSFTVINTDAWPLWGKEQWRRPRSASMTHPKAGARLTAVKVRLF